MKHKITFENASVVGVCDGEITLKLEKCITRVWEPRTVGSIDKWFEITPQRKVIFER